MNAQYKELSFDHIITAISEGKIVEVEKFDPTDKPVWVTISGVITVNELNQLKNNRFRQVTPIINIGGHIIPKPLTEPPEEGARFYMVSLGSVDLYNFGLWDNAYGFYKTMLKRGLMHSTEEAAIAHTKALIAISCDAIQEEADNGTNE